ncbi:MAG: hypothetical protein GY792_25535, partial [Gammaproteobacteria bacterium]|nr:hypothetical protein [Gammaproteobacteria bacterium]
LLLIMALVTPWYFSRAPNGTKEDLRPTPTVSPLVTPTPVAEVPLKERKRRYVNVPYIESLNHIPLSQLPQSGFAQYAGYAAGGMLFILVMYGLYLWQSRKIPEDDAPYINDSEEAPRHFALGSIGGKPAPRFDDESLNHLADSMGYFQSAEAGKRLNVRASIGATVRRGGIPDAVFYRRKQIRSLLILEDALAEPLVWNGLAPELAQGMAQRGVPVIYGRFSGSPQQFRMPDGSLCHLEDLEDQRRGYLLLIFSDGKSLFRPGSEFVLEALARWPMAAWMELREPRFWDHTSALPTRHNIPLYPATPGGVEQALRRFLTEQGAEADFSEDLLKPQAIPGQTAMLPELQIEALLG